MLFSLKIPLGMSNHAIFARKVFWKKCPEMRIKFFGIILFAQVSENQRIFDYSRYFQIWAHSPVTRYKRVFRDIEKNPDSPWELLPIVELVIFIKNPDFEFSMKSQKFLPPSPHRTILGLRIQNYKNPEKFKISISKNKPSPLPKPGPGFHHKK